MLGDRQYRTMNFVGREKYEMKHTIAQLFSYRYFQDCKAETWSPKTSWCLHEDREAGIRVGDVEAAKIYKAGN